MSGDAGIEQMLDIPMTRVGEFRFAVGVGGAIFGS